MKFLRKKSKIKEKLKGDNNNLVSPINYLMIRSLVRNIYELCSYHIKETATLCCFVKQLLSLECSLTLRT